MFKKLFKSQQIFLLQQKQFNKSIFNSFQFNFASVQELKNDFQITELQQTLFQRLAVVNDEFIKINQILTSSSEEYSNDEKEQYRSRLNEIQYINDIYTRMKEQFQVYNGIQKNIKDNEEDEDMLDLIQEELEDNQDKLLMLQEEAIDNLVQKDKYDACQEITIEVRPGVGGSESSLFSEDVFHMYEAYCTSQGWSVKQDQFQRDMSINKGCKLGILKVMGQDCYKRLKAESGIHKVIRVPETEKAGRLHSSTISVVVLPIIPLDFKIDEKDLKFEYMRAQGAGGQHVNKVSSACRATHIATGLSVLIQESRQQHNNKAKAVEILKEKLFQIEVLKHQQMVSSDRQEQMGSGDRSDKIRTYNFPQSRITDHRTNLTLYNIEKMMAGEFLDEFIDTYIEKVQNQKIQTFLKELEQEKLKLNKK